jgi:serine/threonine protein kinase
MRGAECARGGTVERVYCPDVWLGQASLQGIPGFLREVAVLGVYRHPHVVPLLSYSLSRQNGQQEACLVYPLMARGGLDQALAARATRPLDAAARLRIAADAAAGLAFLHDPGAGLAPMLHRDVKSSNVLLDEGLRARLSDVGLARPQHGAAGVGAFGYTDPEYFASGECIERSAADLPASCQDFVSPGRRPHQFFVSCTFLAFPGIS